MATKIGDLYFDVSANTSAVNKALAGIGLAATAAAAIIATELVGAGAKFNVEMQRTTALFSALTGSVEVARDTMREFATLSLDSPIFDAKTLSRAAQLLLTFDVAQQYVGELAENITLASVALGKGTQGATQLARAIGQIQGRGWLEGDEARQLSEVGINAYAVIAEAIGKTTGEVMELGRQSLLLAEDVIPILNDHLNETFGEVAPQLLDTFGVQVQGLGNIFKALGSAIVEPFIGAFSGGALTTGVGSIREALRGLVTESEVGLFELAGALEPFNDLLESMARSVGEVAERFSNWLGSAAAGDSLEGVVSAISLFGSEVSAALSGGIDLVQDIFASLQPTFPAIRDFLGILYSIARDAIPIVADGIRELANIIGLIGPDILVAGTALAAVFGPTLLAVLDAMAASIGLVADGVELIDRFAPVAAVAIGVLTGALVLMNTQLAIAAGATGLQALGLGLAGLGVQSAVLRLSLAAAAPGIAAFVAGIAAIAAPAALVVAALLAIDGAVKGLKGDMDIVTRDLSLLDPRAWLQDLPADAGIAIGEFFGGVSEEELKARQATADYLSDLEADAAALLPTLAQGITSLAEFDAILRSMEFSDPLLAGELRSQFKDFLISEEELTAAREAAAEVKRLADEQKQIQEDGIFGPGEGAIQSWEEFIATLKDFEQPEFINIAGFGDQLFPNLQTATEMIEILETVADDAARALEEMLTPPPGASIDSFLQSLVGLAEDVTNVMQSPAGTLADLDFRVAEESVRQQARELVSALVDEYGLSLREIEDLLNDQGLAGVIEALGLVTEETTEAVDPLIAKYSELGATADVIREAIRRLEDQRTTGLRAQIDQVSAALRDATTAADEARKAFDEFFLGGTGGMQGAIDDLVLAIPKVGDQIEEGLLRGGPQGEAMVRQALGQAGQSLGSIFQLGLEQGLSPEEIISLLEPVYGSISQELGEALNRISTLDWTSGFTPGAAAEIQSWFAGILDPSQIASLFAGITGADAQVTGLQAQLDALQAQMQIDVEFSPEQVQAAIGEIRTEVVTEPVITPEAAQAVYDAIQDVLDSEDLRTTVDQANTTQQIVDAAREAERQIVLDFNSQLVFDAESLNAMARLVGEEFAVIFRQQMITSLGGGIIDPNNPQAGDGPTLEDFIRRGIELGIVSPDAAATQVTIDNDIVINESGSPRLTASEVVAASSAAAGSGGRYDPSRWNRFGPR